MDSIALPVADNQQDQLATQTYQELVAELIKWVADSKLYVKRRKHLSSYEKKQACKELDKYERILVKYHSLYKPKANDLKYALESEYEKVAQINLQAEHYEFPAFPLPSNVEFYIPPPVSSICLEITNNALVWDMFYGDKLTCDLVDPADLELDDRVAVMYRRNLNFPRTTKVGWYGGIEDDKLTLLSDSPRLLTKREPELIPINEVLRLFRVIKLTRFYFDKREVSHE